MKRFAFPAACALMLSVQIGCGTEPPSDEAASPGPSLLPVTITGIADPSSGRMRLLAGPQAALAAIPEDVNGDPATATPGTAQVYGPIASFASGGIGYPTSCNPASPLVMSTDVEILSGFTEQLRNVYARITSVSGGRIFCGPKAPVGKFGNSLNPSAALFLYQPLDGGASAASAVRRTLPWALNLPDNGAFWFRGELWAEVIPQPPTVTTGPADGSVVHTRGSTTRSVSFAWTQDPRADGTNPEGFAVPRPTNGSAEAGHLPLRPGLLALRPGHLHPGRLRAAPAARELRPGDLVGGVLVPVDAARRLPAARQHHPGPGDALHGALLPAREPLSGEADARQRPGQAGSLRGAGAAAGTSRRASPGSRRSSR